ncbi:hypothetical protein FHG66_08580 [Rubellimicrobium rubrum]|uniref:Uncharacterized protein n=1 Tax=Rubellimicrobium rubrum TaxID=2585369 RepID=A0A5C4N2K3_9RHOB|nr:hypothetical protein [Rubellimicrobium rubrum]TNC50534.1 hypothetical protein FHG66_08580 [Rubellimicrobium rubrum]
MLDYDIAGSSPAAERLVQAVVRVLQDVYSQTPGPKPDQQDQFAFDVLLNALCSVLENIRAKSPDEYRTYLGMSLTTLKGD